MSSPNNLQLDILGEMGSIHVRKPHNSRALAQILWQTARDR
uniref:Uncharacterized protein n=1 Tax=Rhizophora mucronata TaxID=61149 RepID=A0A2P2IR11_RHIMU